MAGWAELTDEGRVPASNGRRPLSFDRLDIAVDLAIADLDEDGLADLAVANRETDHVTLLFGIAGRGLRTPGPLEIPRRRLAAPARWVLSAAESPPNTLNSSP